MGTQEISREPCPDRILDDVGGAFVIGAGCGSAFHFLKGLYSSPNGERLLGGAQAVRMNVSRVGGSFAVWGGVYSAFDCSMVYLRRKEDPWNSIIAGAATGGFLKMRNGAGPVARSALLCGALFALTDGIMIALERFSTRLGDRNVLTEDPHGVVPASVAAVAGTTGIPATGHLLQGSAVEDSGAPPTSSWFGRIFGRKPQVATSGSIGSTTDISESSDSPPVPTFEYK